MKGLSHSTPVRLTRGSSRSTAQVRPVGGCSAADLRGAVGQHRRLRDRAGRQAARQPAVAVRARSRKIERAVAHAIVASWCDLLAEMLDELDQRNRRGFRLRGRLAVKDYTPATCRDLSDEQLGHAADEARRRVENEIGLAMVKGALENDAMEKAA